MTDPERKAAEFGSKAASDLWPKVPSGKLRDRQICPHYSDHARLQAVAEKAFQKKWAEIMFKWGEAVSADIDAQMNGED